MRAIARSLSVLTCLVASIAWAGDKTDTVKIGVLTDMTGVFSDLTGNGSVEAAKMAIEKFGGKVNGRPVELVFADHQNKADVGLGILRRWYQVDDVDAVFDFANSAVALGAVDITKEFNRVIIRPVWAQPTLPAPSARPTRSTGRGILTETPMRSSKA